MHVAVAAQDGNDRMRFQTEQGILFETGCMLSKGQSMRKFIHRDAITMVLAHCACYVTKREKNRHKRIESVGYATVIEISKSICELVRKCNNSIKVNEFIP